MIGLSTAALILAMDTPVATGKCKGGDPAIVGVVVKSVDHAGGVNVYTLSGSVMNGCSANQPSNVLQSVEIVQNGKKVDTKGIPPLAAGQIYHFTYVFQRSGDASDGSTEFTFKIHMKQPAGVPGPQDCSVDDDSLTKSF